MNSSAWCMRGVRSLCLLNDTVVRRAFWEAEELRERIGSMSRDEYLKKHGPVRIMKEYRKPAEIEFGVERRAELLLVVYRPVGVYGQLDALGHHQGAPRETG